MMKVLNQYLRLLAKLAGSCKIYLVGGLIRDLVLNRKKDIIDCDLVISENVLEISKKFASRINGHWFVLDEHNQVYRVGDKNLNLRFDFASLKGRDIREDLQTRDYTVNALAVEVRRSINFKNIIDPAGGLRDLHNKVIRAIREENLISDPVRILRGISLSSELRFSIEESTLTLLARHAGLLIQVPGERISEELFKILKNSDSADYFTLLNNLRILDVIFDGWKDLRKPPPGPYHHLPIDEHSIETLRCLEKMKDKIQKHKDLVDYLGENIREQRTRFDILKLSCLLHDIGKPPAYHIEEGKLKFTGHEKAGVEIATRICQRLKFSRRETDILCSHIYYHLRPGFLVDCIHTSRRAVFRYFRDTQEEALAILLLSLADKEATRGELADENDIARHRNIIWSLITEYFQRRDEVKPPRLVTGWDVMKVLNIPSGPLVGKVLREIEEAQAEKKITTREEALRYMEVIYNKLNTNIEK